MKILSHKLVQQNNYLDKRLRYHSVIKRTMISGRCLYAARAAYHISFFISNNSFTDKQNSQPFISQIVANALNDQQGISQHKTTLWKHLSYQRFPGSDFYEFFLNQIPNSQSVIYEPHVLVDFRTNNELVALKEYLQAFDNDIIWLYVTLDSRLAKLPKAQQSNPDFLVYIGKDSEGKCVYQDEKSGMDMLKHATRGSIGVLYYDENGQNVQMTSQPISIQHLIANHKKNIRHIEFGLKQDGLLSDSFVEKLCEAENIVNDMQDKSFQEVQFLHTKLQNYLWDQFQCNPNYNRSISFIFIKQIINSPMTDKEFTFSQVFQSKLNPNHLYNLDKKSDFKEIFNAFIYAGKKIDPSFIDKLYHLHHNGLTLNHDILLIFKEITKNALF